MQKTFYLVIALALTSGLASADSIRVGDKLYRNVYIGVSSEYYYVHHPESGEMERISRRRSNISNVQIDDNEDARSALLARYEAAKAKPQEPARKAPVSQSEVAGETKSFDGDLLKYRIYMRDLAEFETQLAHWKDLSPETQKRIQGGLYETMEQRAARRSAAHEQAVTSISTLEQEKVTIQQHVEAAAIERERAVWQARAESTERNYLEAYKNSWVPGQPQHYYYREGGRRPQVGVYYVYGRDTEIYNSALEERARENNRIAEANDRYEAQTENYGKVLNSVDSAITRHAREAQTTVQKAHDEMRRYKAWQARVAALDAAEEDEYQPVLKPTVVEHWTGAADRRTPDFTIDQGLWRLDCLRAEDGNLGDFAVTVFSAETDAPFTRVSGVDYLGMRSRIFDEPGTYYLVISQSGIPVSYDVTVSTLSQ